MKSNPVDLHQLTICSQLDCGWAQLLKMVSPFRSESFKWSEMPVKLNMATPHISTAQRFGEGLFKRHEPMLFGIPDQGWQL